jgi:hypothetical protein
VQVFGNFNDIFGFEDHLKRLHLEIPLPVPVTQILTRSEISMMRRTVVHANGDSLAMPWAIRDARAA